MYLREIYNGKDTVVKDFKDFVGPADPELARAIRPNSIRAMYGESVVQNAVHCTEVADDAILEVSLVLV